MTATGLLVRVCSRENSHHQNDRFFLWNPFTIYYNQPIVNTTYSSLDITTLTMASAVMDNAKVFANEHLATLRVKLNQIPALQEVEVRECPALKIRVLSEERERKIDSVALGIEKQLEMLDALIAVMPFVSFLL